MKAIASRLKLVRPLLFRTVRTFSAQRPPPQQNVFTGPSDKDLFEELKDETVETKESAAKNLSLKLLQVRRAPHLVVRDGRRGAARL